MGTTYLARGLLPRLAEKQLPKEALVLQHAPFQFALVHCLHDVVPE